VTAFVTAGAGFLLAVLWFDLMFDVQALRHRDRHPARSRALHHGRHRRAPDSARVREVMDGQTRIGNTGAADPGLRGGRMADKSPHFSKDKKKGKTLQEKRAAKRQKRSERRAADEARNRAEGI
jgi:hypothetical protein